MKTSYIVIGIGIAVVIIGGVFLLQSSNNSQLPSLEEEENGILPMMEEPTFLTVVYSDEGYSPKELRIKKGEIVTFKNESSQPMWTASAIHPSHTVYPGTDIKNCQNAMTVDVMFDSCDGISMGSVWKFQFNEVGEWGYHDHLRASHWGKVIVE